MVEVGVHRQDVVQGHDGPVLVGEDLAEADVLVVVVRLLLDVLLQHVFGHDFLHVFVDASAYLVLGQLQK